MKIGIIGAGASGLLTAITSKNDSNEVIVFENSNQISTYKTLVSYLKKSIFMSSMAEAEVQSSRESIPTTP